MSNRNEEVEVKTSKFWMTVDQAERPAAYAAQVPGEFSEKLTREGASGFDRRDFLKVSGASAMMAALAGCTQRPVQKIVPYVTNPEEIIPGLNNYYASVDPATGYGLVLRCREGRPTKVDGNMEHPLNEGAISTRGQASIHDLYDPDRLRAPRIGGAEATWEELDKQVMQALAASKGSTWLLTGSNLSPTLRRVVAEAGIKHVMLDPIPMDDVLDGQAQSYGTRVFPRYRFDRSHYTLSLGADFLGTWGSVVENTRGYTKSRRLQDGTKRMSKLVVFEPVMSLTGQNADVRRSVHPADVLTLALGITRQVSVELGRANDELAAFDVQSVAQHTGIAAEEIKTVAKELAMSKGSSIVVGKDYGVNGVALQNVINYLNSLLGNDGSTIDGTNHSAQFQGSFADFDKLLGAIRTGGVKTLIIAGLNPGYSFAAPLKVQDALSKVPNLVYFGSYSDETAALAKYVAAESHAFEAWGDASPVKDVYGVQQPTIRPLWHTRSLLESLLAWGGAKNPTEASFQEVQKSAKEWHGRAGGGKSFQDWWDDLLTNGVSGKGDAVGAARSFHGEILRSAVAAAKNPPSKGGEGEFSLVLTHSIQLGDGAQANNAQLQELPDPISKNTWGNYLAMSPDTMKRLGWNDGDYVKVETSGSSAELPAYRQPGLREGVVSAHLGYGRRFAGRVGDGVGASFVNFTGSSLTGIRPLQCVVGVRVSRTGRTERLPSSQIQHSLEGRDIIFDTTFDEWQKNPSAGVEREFEGKVPPSIWSGFEYKGYRWGMAIDLSSCTGCSACVVACSVENNVPAVGRDQVQKNREMQWIRIDRYYSGDAANPETLTQPMLCQQCENAPCETVCPVVATTHSDEGLNQMIYNRCVGTKYCSNNCPYKVRRFNWFNNNGDMNGSLEHPIPLSKNPEVTLRSRGVMEKCTFCTQRIESVRGTAKTENRRIKDNELRTACQDACPAGAIVFGDQNDPESRVSKMMKNPRGFRSLEEVNARPQIVYLTKIRNREPAKGEGKPHGDNGEHGHG